VSWCTAPSRSSVRTRRIGQGLWSLAFLLSMNSYVWDIPMHIAPNGDCVMSRLLSWLFSQDWMRLSSEFKSFKDSDFC
jgi:hypothetical protein